MRWSSRSGKHHNQTGALLLDLAAIMHDVARFSDR
jgi:hypothetical protein